MSWTRTRNVQLITNVLGGLSTWPTMPVVTNTVNCPSLRQKCCFINLLFQMFWEGMCTWMSSFKVSEDQLIAHKSSSIHVNFIYQTRAEGISMFQCFLPWWTWVPAHCKYILYNDTTSMLVCWDSSPCTFPSHACIM